MPTLHLVLSTTPEPEVQAQLAHKLTQLTAEVLGKKPAVTALRMSFATPGTWWIGAQPVQAPTTTAYFEINITQGTNSEEQKAQYLAQVFDCLQALLGPLASASYAVVHELPATDWGYGGLSQRQRQLKP